MNNTSPHPDLLQNSASATDFTQSLYYSRTLLNTLPPDSPKESLDNTSNTPAYQNEDLAKRNPICNVTQNRPGIRNYTIKEQPANEPTQSDHDHLRFNAGEVFAPNSVTNARDRYTLNWLNISDLLANLKCLDPRARDLLRMYVKSKWDSTSWLENGLKTTNGTLAQALLLLIAAEAWHIIPNAHAIVESNLRSKDGKYSPLGCKRRFISPRAARGQIHRFKNTFSPEDLFPRHHAYLVLFESPEELRKVGHNPAQRRDHYDSFFAKNRQSLLDCKKSGKIRAFVLSNEVTCSSIMEQIFNPHSHAVIWVDAESDASFLDEFIEAGELIKYHRDPKTNWADLKNFLYYMMRAHSLASVYEREFNVSDPVSFNKATVNALHSLIQLQCGDGGGQGKRKLFSAGIPKRKRK